MKQPGILFDLLPDLGPISRIHDEESESKGHIADPLKLLQKLCHQHGVFSPGDANCDFIPLLYKLISLDRSDKGIPQFLAVFFDNAPFNGLIRCKLTGHPASLLSLWFSLSQTAAQYNADKKTNG
jgi:hypothetical protein